MRRSMPAVSRFFALFLVGAMLAVAPLSARDAEAFDVWCWDDPIVSVGGRLVDIQVQVPLNHLVTMRSTALTVIVPSNVPGSVIVDNASAFPMKTTISPTGPAWSGRGGVPITIIANVTASQNFPIRLSVTQLADLYQPLSVVGALLAGPITATGTANQPLQMTVTLGR